MKERIYVTCDGTMHKESDMSILERHLFDLLMQAFDGIRWYRRQLVLWRILALVGVLAATISVALR
jgi:hypothetical protein